MIPLMIADLFFYDKPTGLFPLIHRLLRKKEQRLLSIFLLHAYEALSKAIYPILHQNILF